MKNINIFEALPKDGERITFWVFRDIGEEELCLEEYYGMFIETEDGDYFYSLLDPMIFPGERKFYVADQEVLFWRPSEPPEQIKIKTVEAA